MERNALEELKAHLMASDETFRRLVEEHASYAKKIDALEALTHPSDQEQIEEHRLKKLKLQAKDRMEAMLARYRAQQVA
jgi:uncharacterized protein YdcH (DUF465 family)